MKWIKHDTDAHRDAKLRRVQMKYGMEGYGLYWYCLELIAAGLSEHNLTCELEHDSEVIAHDTGIHFERVQEMIVYMVNLGLFEESQGVITCLKLVNRLDQSMTSSPRMRKLLALAKENHDGVMMGSGQSHDGVMTESCKTRLDKTRQDKNTRRFTPPSEEEVAERIREMGYEYSVAADFCNFYGSKNWMVGKNKMADWHKALGGWESRKKSDAKDKGDASGEVSYF